MRRTRSLVVIGLAVVATACGGDEIAERIAENRIEAGGGGDVDIDVDDGDVSVKTEDGEFSIQTDDDGNVSIEGIGDRTTASRSRIDAHNGETVVETEDGTSVITQSTDLPDGFPADVPLPDGIEIQFAQSSSETGQGTGYVDRSDLGSFDESNSSRSCRVDSKTNGFERQQLTETPDGTILLYQRSDYDVAATFSRDDGDGTGFQLTLIPGG